MINLDNRFKEALEKQGYTIRWETGVPEAYLVTEESLRASKVPFTFVQFIERHRQLQFFHYREPVGLFGLPLQALEGWVRTYRTDPEACRVCQESILQAAWRTVIERDGWEWRKCPVCGSPREELVCELLTP